MLYFICFIFIFFGQIWSASIQASKPPDREYFKNGTTFRTDGYITYFKRWASELAQKAMLMLWSYLECTLSGLLLQAKFHFFLSKVSDLIVC